MAGRLGIVLGSSNPAKRRRMRWLLEGLPLDFIDPPATPAEESAPTFRGNAELKALAYSYAGHLAISTDGGLGVPALGDAWNPLRTHRQGQALLRQLAANLEDRRVRWHEAVAIGQNGQILASWEEAATEGLLAPEPWPVPGDQWAHDLFVFPSTGKRWTDMTADELAPVEFTWARLKEAVQAYFATFHAAAAYS